MTCIIVDDEPLARDGIQLLIDSTPELTFKGSFQNPVGVADLLASNPVDLIFLDIQMPGMNGIEFARSIPDKTLIIFTTAYTVYALDSYEVDAIDYLVKPIHPERFQKAVGKALSYHALLNTGPAAGNIASVAADFMFVKADRKFFKVLFKDLLFIEGLKDYVILHLPDKKIVTAMNIKTIYEQLPKDIFVRIHKSYIINIRHITSFDNNTVCVQKQDIPIGDSFRAYFFEEFVMKRLISR